LDILKRVICWKILGIVLESVRIRDIYYKLRNKQRQTYVKIYERIAKSDLRKVTPSGYKTSDTKARNYAIYERANNLKREE
jgi:hypothetical protein